MTPLAKGVIIASMRISGLGSCSTGTLTPEQIFQVAQDAGFPPDVATQMVAIALRESGGCPTAYNGGSPPGTESSYGLWQINVKGNPGIVAAIGASSSQDLFDPYWNAQAAAYLWGGNPSNLDIAWYINRPGYSEAYQGYLPVAQQAAYNVLGVSAPLGPSPLPDIPSTGVLDSGTVLLAGAGLLGLLLLTR